MKFLIFFVLLFCVVIYCDDLWIRNYFMPISAAAYSDNPKLCLTNIKKYWNNLENVTVEPTFYRQYKINCDALNNTCSSFISVDSGMQYINFGFRGTPKYEEFFEHNWNYSEMVKFVAGGKVNKYFFDAFNGIWNNAGMKNDFLTLKNRHPDYTVNIVGHSIGGALASLAAATIISTRIQTADNVLLITFGQPRTGDKDYANVVNAMMIYPYRVVHNLDIIPHFPPLNFTVYYHHTVEIWYPNNMKDGDAYVSCSFSDGEDPKCSDSFGFSALKGNEHKYYFDREVSVYGIDGCPDLATKNTYN